ncbi:hypothetical protein FSW04_24450 [Baekduia soli]|uniref:Uncharacterized protein n=1 Tax=Baekduia soli TaxID=496014 RepID=A0A5B8UBR1_9ACTN|nr:hypothetical protein [Baekduia soli]QEC50424.1 hypothetical protein FSW04_24450 [Baekduia soli]
MAPTWGGPVSGTAWARRPARLREAGAGRPAAVLRSARLDGRAEPADLRALRGWIDDPAAYGWGATVTRSRELLIAQALTAS